MKKLIFFLLSFFFLFSKESFANDTEDNFSIKLESSYTVNAAGKTLVNQKFTITNKTPEYFISKYGIILSSTNLDKIEVSSNGQKIDPQVSKQKGETSIGVSFEDQIVGENKVRDLIIKYVDADISQISGKILEVNIPQLADHYQYESYQLKLIIPNIFGNPSRISPSDFTLQKAKDFNTIIYNNLQGKAISAIFGELQIFDLKINYQLKNPTSQNALSQITLPPETPFQKIHYHNLDPLPNEVKEDQDGNFIATYELAANNSLNVELFAKVMLTLNSNPTINFTKVLDAHLIEQKYWESNTTLKEIANNLESVESIYDYAIETLEYTEKPLDQYFSRLGSIAAIKEINKNNATCQEFTDLFIALSRGKGVPARRIVGYAYSNNEELRPVKLERDVLHTWPEYYNRETESWTPIDPTWGDTTGGIDYFNKFDLNHIIFAINGASSTLPYPAGSYSANEDEKQRKIFIDFATEDFPNITPQLEMKMINKKISKFSLPGNYQLEISNPSGQVWYFSTVDFKSENLKIKKNYDDELIRILPFSKITLAISIYNQDSLINKKGEIKVKIQLKEGQSFEKEFEVISSSSFEIKDPERIIALGGGIILATLITASLFLLGRKWAKSLRKKGKKLEEEGHKLQEISKTLEEKEENTLDKSKYKNKKSSKK